MIRTTSMIRTGLFAAFITAYIGAYIGASTLVAADESSPWPEFRGPSGNGHAEAHKLPSTWSEKANVGWKTALPGRGWSSPIIARNSIWMTTAVESEPTAKQLERAKNAGDPALRPAGEISLRVVSVDMNSGNLLLDRELFAESNPDPIHSLNSFASPTPVYSDGYLYCHFGANGTACVNTENGETLWQNRNLRIRHENGPGSSPIVWRDLLIFHCDGSDQQYIVALQKLTGDIAWKASRTGKMNDNPQLKKAYGTPLIVSIDDKPVLLSPAADWLYAYDPESGRELWKLSYNAQGFSIVPRPVAGHGMLFFSTSFMQAEILAVKLDGEQPEIAWRTKKQAPQMPSPLLVGDELYFVSDRGIATCVDARSGRLHWSERLGGNFCSSPLYADGKIFVGNREGSVFVLSPGKSYRLLATNQLDGALMASPIAIGHALFIRTDSAIYRIEDRSET